jgi:hypothetical protein
LDFLALSHQPFPVCGRHGLEAWLVMTAIRDDAVETLGDDEVTLAAIALGPRA